MSLYEDPRRRVTRTVRARRRRAVVIGVSIAVIVLLGGGAAVWAVAASQQHTAPSDAGDPADSNPITKPKPAPKPKPEPQPEPAPEPEPEPEPSPEPAPAPPADAYSAPDSLTVVVNKQRPLNPIDWEPYDLVWPNVPNSSGHPLRAAAASALEQMYAGAAAAGVPFTITSGYRPYWMQVDLFNSYAQRDGVAAAERYSARAGHSEHQTGLAADLDDGSGCAFLACFGDTATGQWLRHNAHHYGFILRYHDGAEGTVGYLYEPWHFRYLGVDIASDMYNSGVLNLEDYLGLPPAPVY